MWIVGAHFQVDSTGIVSRGLMVYQSTWISDGYHVKIATSLHDFVSLVFNMYFSHESCRCTYSRVYLLDIM